MKKSIHKTASLPLSIAFGVLTGMIVTFLGALLMTYLTNTESMQLQTMTTLSAITQLVAAAVGVFVSTMLVRERQLITGMVTAAAYFLILLAGTAMFFGGEYDNVGVGALVIMAAGSMVVLLRMRGKKKPAHRRKIRANR